MRIKNQDERVFVSLRLLGSKFFIMKTLPLATFLSFDAIEICLMIR